MKATYFYNPSIKKSTNHKSYVVDIYMTIHNKTKFIGSTSGETQMKCLDEARRLVNILTINKNKISVFNYLFKKLNLANLLEK